MITDEQVLAGMDPNGAVMKYGDIVGHVAAGLGIADNTIYGEVGQILQRMKRGGRVELVKGKGSGWRRVARNVAPPVKALGPSNDDSLTVQLEMGVASAIAAGGGLDGLDENPYIMDGGIIHFAIADEQGDAWAWDISRPLAEQLAETAADDAAADALVELSDADRLALSAQAGEDEHDAERVRQGLSPIRSAARSDGSS